MRHHTIDDVELTVTDVAASKAFYAAAFGWQFTDYGPDSVGIQGNGREQGGLTKGTPRVAVARSSFSSRPTSTRR